MSLFVDEKTKEERWKELPQCPGYSVSSTGRLKSPRYKKILSGTITPKGYVALSVMLNGKPKIYRAHVLVCELFNGPKPSLKHQVNHIDGNKLNNTPQNLEWVTPAENTAHSIQFLGNAMRGERSGSSKLDDMKVLTIRTFKRHPNYKANYLASLFGVSITTIRRVGYGELWKHI